MGQGRPLNEIRAMSGLSLNVLQNSFALGDRIGGEFLAMLLSSSPNEGVGVDASVPNLTPRLR
jgi:hypothetical protein